MRRIVVLILLVALRNGEINGLVARTLALERCHQYSQGKNGLIALAAAEGSGVGVDALWRGSLGESGEGAKQVTQGVKSGATLSQTTQPTQSTIDEGSNKDEEELALLDLDNPNADDLYTEFGMIEETVIDKSIEKAVRQIIEEGLGKNKEPELTPVEIFQGMYREIKSRNKQESNIVAVDSKEEAAVMLEKLLGGDQCKDPFDERQVMMKLKNMLVKEDFTELFKDPSIGDIM
jgi:hypothetical protein